MHLSFDWLYLPQREFVIEWVFRLFDELLTVNGKTRQCAAPRENKNRSVPAFNSDVC
jgi:hypothetical protein